MDQKTIEIMEFPQVKNMLAELAGSKLGRRLAENITPHTEPEAITVMLRETTEAKLILDASGTPPMYGLADIGPSLQKVKIGGTLDPSSLEEIGNFLRGCRKTREFMVKRMEMAPQVARYALGLTAFPEVEEELDHHLLNGMVTDDASPELKKLRREIERLQDKIKQKLQQFILSPEAKTLLQEPVIGYRDGRPVLMVKAAHKQRLPGVVLGSSGSGGTLFVEPLAIHQLGNDLQTVKAMEQAEVERILGYLTHEIAVRMGAIEQNLEIMAQYDLAFAKARLSRAMQGIEPALDTRGRIHLIGARHPLLKDTPVPLDFYIGRQEGSAVYRTLVITGPNTGGKTVTLKTIGLLTLMAQSGLHIPAADGSVLGVFREIMADIGDGQNITQSLSTFSSHIQNINRILGSAGRQVLVLLDEIGTGTDPSEGAALATAILEYLYEQGTTTIATTHYPEIKEYALATPGFKNGSMAFDREKLKPLYQLLIGRPGESNALWIAAKLGLPERVLDKARRQLNLAIPPQPSVEKTDSIEDEAKTDWDKTDDGVIASFPEPLGMMDRSAPVMVEQEIKSSEEMRKSRDKQPDLETVEDVETQIKIGDMVTIPFLQEKGVVCTAPDAKGRIRVLIKGKKMDLPVKRVHLLVPAEQLYPENYDMNIVFLTKEERKLKHAMERKCVPGQMRRIMPEEQ